MADSDTEVLIVGGGAAGIAAARSLVAAGIACLIVEARGRLGGRAWTVADASGHGLDLGCGWLHSADRNPWSAIAEQQGRVFDKSPPPWTRPSMTDVIPLTEQKAFQLALKELFERVSPAVADGRDRPASDLLPADGRWNGLLNAAATYIAGAEFERMSTLDFDRYEDTEVNWRVREGYGAVIAKHGEGLLAIYDCPVRRVDYRGKRLKIETDKGDITADRAIVTLPTTVLAEQEEFFQPALPDKTHAAHGLPLGLADKLFMSFDGADDFETEGRLFGRLDRVATGNYHFRPFGRPMIEAYFGGQLARELEAAGEAAFFDFSVSELTALLGHDFGRRIKPIRIHRWAADPYARGSYSFAVPGAADERAVLAETVDGRLYFAGEACSPHDFSTAHGAYQTGIDAADAITASRKA
ncbi:MAG TPA: NAD(P)/FAD-dependent oxidoreductase [Pseudolabrys sp.]|nr:NAD(P)/FAD-dependent oxidoreductase [Pseudolabrys sp.]